MTDRTLHRVNVVLLWAIIVVNAYVILLPFLPTFTYWWKHRDAQAEQTISERLRDNPVTTDENSPTTADTFQAGPARDGLIIPRMFLDTPLIEGPASNSFNLLNKGAWRLPYGSTPAKGGNTVIAGHRFSYTGPRGVFYYLDKLQPGDEIGLWYQGTLYTYAVSSKRTVAATEVSVQQPTRDTRLTLYTCTPLWNPKDRLVIVAYPIGDI